MENLFRKIHYELKVTHDKSKFEINDENETEKKQHLNISLPTDNLSTDERILQPFAYLMTRPGKHFREECIFTLNNWLKAPESVVTSMVKFFYLVHNIGLMLDDVQDMSFLRRGIPCCHRVCGTPNTINSVQFLLAAALEIVSNLKNPKVSHLPNGHAEATKTIRKYFRR
ncbi:hypothetical protein ILUMI_12553 [Ignelater luminosus]|uniref:Uncharacterized protein n=1 Tax=Ignelater luminosus TaxID=2038154 RepID=A0A8K0D2L3_IGNLU|nr:hypothetical protein ILUMI_12553 [Ignelater luminosus]